MGVWLKSRSRKFKLRDGKGFGAEMKVIGADEPVWFENLRKEDFLWDSDLLVVHEADVVKKKPEPAAVAEEEEKPKRRARKILSL